MVLNRSHGAYAQIAQIGRRFAHLQLYRRRGSAWPAPPPCPAGAECLDRSRHRPGALQQQHAVAWCDVANHTINTAPHQPLQMSRGTPKTNQPSRLHAFFACGGYFSLAPFPSSMHLAVRVQSYECSRRPCARTLDCSNGETGGEEWVFRETFLQPTESAIHVKIHLVATRIIQYRSGQCSAVQCSAVQYEHGERVASTLT